MKVKTPKTRSLIDHISIIPDPRMENKCDHSLENIMAIAISAIIAGAEDWNSIVSFGKAKKDWFDTFLDLKNGIPSHDTFRRFFSILSADAFEEFFTNWVKDIAGIVKGVIAIDGKTVRRSHGLGKKAIHMVSAWSAEKNLVLGQVKTEEKSNEITAIPKLLNVLDLKGCIVTIDAMGCQKSIAKNIIDGGGDYLLALKGNQEKLCKRVEEIFQESDLSDYEGYDADYYETQEKSRDRYEVRRHWTLDVSDMDIDTSAWSNLNIIGMVESQRTIKDETSVEYRYYIGSIENDAELFAQSVRAHWGVENSLHWQLDMSFREDESRMRKGHSQENFSVMRRIALNLIKNEKSIKLGVKNKRLRAGWDEAYLAKLLISGGI